MCAIAMQYNFSKPVNKIGISLDQSHQLVAFNPSPELPQGREYPAQEIAVEDNDIRAHSLFASRVLTRNDAIPASTPGKPMQDNYI